MHMEEYFLIRKTDDKRKPVAVDLFCGVGGLGLGVEQAGFNVRAAFDLLPFNTHSYAKNFPSTRSITADLSKCSGEDIRILGKIGSADIDLVFGGPPCQGFSYGGKRDLNDGRNLLLLDFIRIVRQLRPKYFLMENVQGLVSEQCYPVLETFIRRAKRAGYGIVEPVQVLNAVDFGVPQRRKRVIVLGYRNDMSPPTYPAASAQRNARHRRSSMTVLDAFDGLPLIEGNADLFTQDIFRGKIPRPRRKYARILQGLEQDSDDHSEPRILDSFTGFLRTRHSLSTIRRFEATKPGSVEPISRYFRLDWGSIAPTLRAGTGEDHGRHTAPRPIHPDYPRCITTREAARLHSFPDWFVFHGTRWNDFRQIGNSVPPLLARAVAKEILHCIQSDV